ncbi:hypothetical protein MBLNU457_5724t1 [Dothideomycetes sp. NU457]
MGLDDFERELAAGKVAESSESRDRRHHRGEDRHRSRHHHRSSRHDDSRHDDRHGHKRRHHRDRDDREERHRSKRSRSDAQVVLDEAGEDDASDEWVEKEAMTAPPEEDILDERDQSLQESKIQRDSWMEAPSALDIDYLQQNRRKKSPPSQFVSAKEDHERKIHRHEVDEMLRDLEEDEDEDAPVEDEPAQHDVSYTFGDGGANWRMTKLRGVYRKAKEDNKSVDEVALKTYGDLRLFDDAREEERELDRRETYGKDYVGLEKPSGEFFQERKMAAGKRRKLSASPDTTGRGAEQIPQGQQMDELPAPSRTVPLDQTALNKLKAQLMKAKLRKDPKAADLEAEYNAAAAAASANGVQADVVVLSNMDNRMLAGGRGNEVKAIDNKRGRERGTVVENEDMSIEDMVRHEKRTRGMQGGEGRAFAERIAKDAKFDNDLDYMDDNATKLAKNVAKSDINLRNTAIGEFQKMQKILDNCPLCHHEDTSQPPVAPLVSLATRTYLTLATEPELTSSGAAIVPIQHRLNLLECDDDEWEEIRNFMKSLTRMYHASNRGVIFYENAANMGQKRHAAMFAVPLPMHLADTAPGFFKEAILASDEEWSQHRKIIDTLALSQRPGYGKSAFRKAMVKEMAYFHVWFGMDGGLGHVVEDERRWPKGDLFAREILGGMLDKGPEIVKRQGRWVRQDPRLEGFRKRWDKWDWTKALMNAQ